MKKAPVFVSILLILFSLNTKYNFSIAQEEKAAKAIQGAPDFEEITPAAKKSIKMGINWMVKQQNDSTKDVDGSWG